MGKQRGFIKRYQGPCSSDYNHGKSSRQRKRARRMGNRIMRGRLIREIKDEWDGRKANL